MAFDMLFRRNPPQTLGVAPPGMRDVSRALPGVPIFDITMTAIAFLGVLLRLYTRAWIKAAAGWDDALIIVGMVFGIAYLITTMIEIYDGHYGHHHVLLTPAQLITIQKTNIAVNTFNPVSLAFTRASIIVFLLRIIGSIRKWRRMLHAGLLLNFAIMLGTCITYWIMCIPMHKYFYPKTPGWCLNRHTLDVINKVFSGLNCVIDFECALIPFFAIQHVQIDRRTKHGLFVILGCGLITASCSIGRAVGLRFASSDPQWDLVPLSYWVAAEMYGAIVCACLPALRQFSTHYLKHRNIHRQSRTPVYTTEYSNSGRSRMRLTNMSGPTSSSTASGGHGHGPGDGAHQGVGKRTDVYIELNEVERDGRTESREGLRRNDGLHPV